MVLEILKWAGAFLALGFMIVVHEGGHYVVARWCQMRIERFSIGFGPGILKRKSKTTGTTFQLAPIPFGGFVEIRGMNIAEEVDPEDLHAYPNRPAWQRFVTIFAGPGTNYLSAIVIAMALYTCHGMDNIHRGAVGSTMEGFDAHGKLLRGDVIQAVDHQPQYLDEGPSLPERIKASKGAPITITVVRDGQPRDITLTPKPDKDKDGKDTWRIGVVQEPEVVKVGVGTAIGAALRYPVDETRRMGAMLHGIIFGNEKADVGGPIRMLDEIHRAISVDVVYAIKFVMTLSVWLGLFNLFPIPALDGGRLVFLAYELITRRRANPKIEAMVHMAGIMALGILMIFVLVVDVRRFF